MDTFYSCIQKLERDLLNKVCELDVSNDELNKLDDIKLEISRSFSQIKLLVDEGIRAEQMHLKPNNLISMFHCVPLVYINILIEEENTVRARSKFMVLWGPNHDLNVVRQNRLTICNKESSFMLALIALFSQLKAMGIIKIHIFTESELIGHIIDHLPVWEANGYMNGDGLEMSNSYLRQKLIEKMEDLIIGVTDTPQEQTRNKYNQFRRIMARIKL